MEMSWVVRHESTFGRNYYHAQVSINKPAAPVGRCGVAVYRGAFPYAPFGRDRGLVGNVVAEGPGCV